MGGVLLASKAIDLDRDRIRKLRGETVPEFVRNSKGRVDFELRTCIRKKGTLSPRPRQRYRPRFSDLSFLQQPCPEPYIPPPLHTVYVYTVYLFTQGRGEWGRVEPGRESYSRGVTVHKAGVSPVYKLCMINTATKSLYR